MKSKKISILAILFTIFTINAIASNKLLNNLNDFQGNWHLRVLDGKEVRKARAIIDFHPKNMMLMGFDGCNKFSGGLKRDKNNIFSSNLMSTRMACRQTLHSFVSSRLQKTIKEGFTIQKDKKYGIDGITIKSKSHTLFFKHMGS